MPTPDLADDLKRLGTECGHRGIQLADSGLYFTVSLAFSVLGLSTQFPKTTAGSCWAVIELWGWCVLFISGMLGLVVAVLKPFPLFGLSAFFTIRAHGAEDMEMGTKHSRREKWLIYAGLVHAGLLLVGLIILFLARSVPHALGLF